MLYRLYEKHIKLTEIKDLLQLPEGGFNDIHGFDDTKQTGTIDHDGDSGTRGGEDDEWTRMILRYINSRSLRLYTPG